jgi:Neuraminidase (sialidase)
MPTKLLCALLLPAILLPASDIAFPPRVKEIESLKAAPYARLRDGSIVTVEGNFAHVTRDGGKTWDEPRPLFTSGQNLKVSNERVLLRTRNGVLILAFMNLADLKWKWDKAANQPAPDVRLDVWTIRSLDEGKTWQDAQNIQPGYCGAVRHLLQTSKGRVVLTSQNILFHPGRHATLTHSSDDDGKTWRPSNIIDLGGHGHHDGAIESTITELKDGRLWMLLRTNWDRFWEAFSDDGGRYWRVIRPSSIEASSSPGYLLRLASGRLALAWNRLYAEGQTTAERRGGDYSEVPGSWQREELSIAFSDDDGKTWTPPAVIASKPKTWLSYPWIFEPQPGELWITTMQGNVRASLREADFTTPARRK